MLQPGGGRSARHSFTSTQHANAAATQHNTPSEGTDMPRRFVHIRTRTTAVIVSPSRNSQGLWQVPATWYQTDKTGTSIALFETQNEAESHYARATPATYRFTGGDKDSDWRETRAPARTRRPSLQTDSGIAAASTQPPPRPPRLEGIRLENTQSGPLAKIAYLGEYPPDIVIGTQLPATPELTDAMQPLGLGTSTEGMRVLFLELDLVGQPECQEKRYTYHVSIPPRLRSTTDADSANAAIRYERALHGHTTDGKTKRQISFDD